MSVLIYRDKVKQLGRIIGKLNDENKALTYELNQHKMALRRRLLQRETERLKPYSDILLNRMNALYPEYSFTFEVREDVDRPEPNTLFIIIRDKNGVMVDHNDFMDIRSKAIEIADQFPVEIDIGYGNS